MNPYLYCFTHHLPRVVAKAVIRKTYDKNSASVREHYEAMRRQILEQFRAKPPSLEDYCTAFASGEPQMMLLDNRPSWDVRAVRNRFIDDLVSRVEKYGARTVVEVGSGIGRNVLAIKQRLPEVDIVGLELSPASVELSREAAKLYGLLADFREFDATGDWSDAPQADLYYTVHCLEQMRKDATSVIDRMKTRAGKAVVMLEPFPDFWTGFRGLARKIRATDSHRLRPGSFAKYSPVEASARNYGTAVNLPSLVVIEP